MRIITTDDEKGALRVLTEAVKEAAPDAEVREFRSPSEAIAYAGEEEIDVAFLDIKMREMTGLELAKKLKAIHPKINVIFVTGFSNYMADAIHLHASGYVMKPVCAEDVQRELENLLHPVAELQDAYIVTFGRFELMHKGTPAAFKLSKAKEMLAILVDCQGRSISRKDMSAILFDDEPYDLRQQNYFSKIVKSLQETLDECGAGDCFVREHNAYRIDFSKISCDAIEFFEGNPKALNAFHGEYMIQYSWAEQSYGRFA